MESKSPSPGKDWVGVVDEEESTRVPSDSSDVVSSGEKWEDLSQTQNQNLNPVGKCCCVFQVVLVFGLPA